MRDQVEERQPQEAKQRTFRSPGGTSYYYEKEERSPTKYKRVVRESSP